MLLISPARSRGQQLWTGNGSQGVYGNTVPTSRSFNLTFECDIQNKIITMKKIVVFIISIVAILSDTGCKKFVDVNTIRIIP